MAQAEVKTSAKPNQLHLAIEKDTRIDRWIEHVCRWLNPILIKESRQSLKSYQFMATFALILFAALFWCFAGLATIPIRTASGSTLFLSGFNWILLFPLTIVVPVWTFWSQVSEQEENSLELVTLSTMRPSQIVSGKLITAFLQVMIYVSVLAPCMSFTYLLRGISISNVGFSLVIVLVATIALNCIALFLATSATSRALQVIFLIGLVLGCFATFFIFGVWLAIINMDGVVKDILAADGSFVGFIGFCLLFISYSIVAFQAAVTNITFPSDNRSTKLRLALMLQQILFIGWSLLMYRYYDFEFLIFAIIYALIHWTLVGFLLVGESGRMSQRIKRGLPRTFFGKMFFSWLMPGPQRGYFFALSNIWAIGIIFSIVAIYETVRGNGLNISPAGGDLEISLIYFFLMCGYATIYLGVTAIIAAGLRRVFDFPFPILTLVLGIMNAFFLLFIPVVVASSIFFDPFEVPILISPSWSMVCYGMVSTELSLTDPLIWIPFLACFVPIVLINLMIAVRELGYRREQAPQRVQEEMALENPAPVDEEIDIFADDA